MSGVDFGSRSYAKYRVIVQFAQRFAALSLAILAETTDLVSVRFRPSTLVSLRPLSFSCALQPALSLPEARVARCGFGRSLTQVAEFTHGH